MLDLKLKSTNSISLLIFLPLLIFLASGCAQYEYSQFRSDTENKERFAQLYYQAIQTCDGRDESDHRLCVSAVKKEITDRFDDRNKAFMTQADVVRIIATQLLIEYATDKPEKTSKSAPSKQYEAKSPLKIPKKAPELAIKGPENLSMGNIIRTTRSRACVAAPFSFSLSMGRAIPIVCK